MEGLPRVPLIPVSLPPEANGCLIRHGGCHVHAECIPTGPQQVSTTGLDTGAVPFPHRVGPPRQGLGVLLLSRVLVPSWVPAAPLTRIWDRSPAAAARVTVEMASGPVISWTLAPRLGPQAHLILQREETKAGVFFAPRRGFKGL